VGIVLNLPMRNLGGSPTGLEPATFSVPQSDATGPSPSWCVRSFALFMRCSATLKSIFIRYVLACISPVAVRLQ
jgi:hypothetical protein